MGRSRVIQDRSLILGMASHTLDESNLAFVCGAQFCDIYLSLLHFCQEIIALDPEFLPDNIHPLHFFLLVEAFEPGLL